MVGPLVMHTHKACFWNAGTQEGHAFCFLPLPVQTGLPVHVNAFFELSSNRRDIWWVLHLILSSMFAWPGVTRDHAAHIVLVLWE